MLTPRRFPTRSAICIRNYGTISITLLVVLLLSLPVNVAAWNQEDHKVISRAAATAVNSHYAGSLANISISPGTNSVIVADRTCMENPTFAINGDSATEILAQNAAVPDLIDLPMTLKGVSDWWGNLFSWPPCFVLPVESQQYRHTWFLDPTGTLPIVITPLDGFLPIAWGNAPDNVDYYYQQALDAFTNGDDHNGLANKTGLFYLSLAGHYVEDMGVPYHVGHQATENAITIGAAHNRYEADVSDGNLYPPSSVNIVGKPIPVFDTPGDYARDLAHYSRLKGYDLQRGYFWIDVQNWWPGSNDLHVLGRLVLVSTTKDLLEQSALHAAGLYAHLFRQLPQLQVGPPQVTNSQVNVTVYNSGPTAANDVLVRLVRTDCSGAFCNPVSQVMGDQSITIPPGIPQVITFQTLNDPPTPTMRYEIIIDPLPLDGRPCGLGGAYGCILQQGEVNTTAPVAPHVVFAPLPDLSIEPSGIHVFTASNQVVADIENAGPGNATAFEVRLYNRDPGTTTPVFVTSQWIANGLQSGHTLSVPLNYTGTLVDPIVRVDENSNVAEVDDVGNNQAAVATWTIQSPTTYTSVDVRPAGDVTIASGASLNLASSNLWLAPGARLTVEDNATLEFHHGRLAPSLSGGNYTATVHGSLILEDVNVTGVAGGLRFDGLRATITSSRLASMPGAPAMVFQSGNVALANNQFRNGEGQGILVSGDAVVKSLYDTFQGNQGTSIDARGGYLTLNHTVVQASPTALALSGGAYVRMQDSTLAPAVGTGAPTSTVAILNNGGILDATSSTATATTALRGNLGSLTFHGGSLQGTQLLDASGSLVVNAHGTQTSGTRSTTGESRVSADWPLAIQALSPAPDSFVIPYAKVQVSDSSGAPAWNGTTDQNGQLTIQLPEFTQTSAGATTPNPYTVQAQHNGAPVTYTVLATAARSLTVRPPVLPDLAVVDVAPAYDSGQSLLWARIKNVEPASAANVTVQFQVDGIPVGQTTLSWVPGSGLADATVPRPPLSGIHAVTARVDPLAAIPQTRTDNDALTRQAWVVTTTESCTGSRALNGTLEVLPGGRLNLNACTVTLGGDAGHPSLLEIKSGATLNLTNGASLNGIGSQPYDVQVAGSLQADHSTITGAAGISAQGASIQLHQATLNISLGTLLSAQNSAVDISGSTLHGGNLSSALHLKGGSVSLRGNQFNGFGGDTVALQNLGTGVLKGNHFNSHGAAYTVANVSLTIADEVIDPAAAHSFVAYVSKLTLLNVTHDFDSVLQDQASQVSVAWHTRAGIVGVDGEMGSGSITAIDRFGTWRQQQLTGTNGWTPDLQLVQFVATDINGDGKTNLSVERQVLTPYTLMSGAHQVSFPVTGNADGLVAQTYAPKLRTTQGYFEGNPAATFQFAVQGYDTGNGNNTLSFSLSGATPGWTATVTPSSAVAPVGGSASATVSFTAPNQQNAVGFVNVTATGEDGTTAPVLRLWAKTGINTPPNAFFSAAAGIAYRSDQVQFRDYSRDNDGWIANWTWDFGDGSTSYAANPTHAYSTLGTKTARLTVTDNTGATATTTNTVQVVNRPPSILDVGVSPHTATGSETVTYTATYRDLDGDAPSYMRVLVDGQAHGMTATTSTSYALGRTYEWQTTGLAAGTHGFRFDASDGVDAVMVPNGYNAVGPTINNPPTLTSPTVSPPSGTANTVFTYRVVYRDPDNNAPQYVNAVVDGTGLAMVRESSTAQSYTTGVAYVANQLMPMGSHTVSFTASDGQSTASTATQQGPEVLGTSPLQNPVLTPSLGAPGTQFTFRATYHESGGLAPDTVTLVLDGQNITMSQESSAGGAYTYRAIVTITAAGHHAYYVTATRAGSTYRLPETGTLDGPLVNTLPTASLASFPTGTIETYFTADASASSDAETATASLEAHVDWGDGNPGYWMRNLAQQHHYLHPGTYHVTLRVRDLNGGISQATRDVTVNDAPPTAAYTVTPGVGNAAENNPYPTQFVFGTATSGDLEDSWDALQMRWDWEGDGTWDTEWLPAMTRATHVYPYAGAYTPTLAVQDSQGHTSTVGHSITVDGIHVLAIGATPTSTILAQGHRQVWKLVLPDTIPPPLNMEATVTWSSTDGADLDAYGQKGSVPNAENCAAPCRFGTTVSTDGRERACWGLPTAGAYYIVVDGKYVFAPPLSYQINVKTNVAETRTDLATCATAGAGQRVLGT